MTRWNPPPDYMRNPSLVNVLATAFLAGNQSQQQVTIRARHTLGKPARWLDPVIRRYLQFFSSKTRPRHRDVVQFLLADPDFNRTYSNPKSKLNVIADWLPGPQQMQPVHAAKSWDIPSIESEGDLADWLQLTASELEWFADRKHLGRHPHTNPKLQHYNYRVLSKRSGHIRLIEAPKPRLKEIQREILASILDKIPPHSAAHGFLKGRSIRTFVSPHVGQQVVLRMDLRDFFPSITAARIQTVFRTMGYPETVADLLGCLCTTATPRKVWAGIEADPLLLQDAKALHTRCHLPQGAPTSPSLANLCCYRIDCRLNGLANAVGAKYTRYADDLAFSAGSDFHRNAQRFATHVAAILMEEGFAVNHRKTRIMRQGVRQHLAGLVANQHMNVVRKDFDRLKAILANCLRHGPANQNREAHPHFRAHLDGRVSFVESINPIKGIRLRAIFDAISWSEF